MGCTGICGEGRARYKSCPGAADAPPTALGGLGGKLRMHPVRLPHNRRLCRRPLAFRFGLVRQPARLAGFDSLMTGDEPFQQGYGRGTGIGPHRPGRLAAFEAFETAPTLLCHGFLSNARARREPWRVASVSRLGRSSGCGRDDERWAGGRGERLPSNPPYGRNNVMLTLATISAFLLATAAVIRAFRAVERQTLLAIQDGKALWAGLGLYKKNLR